MMRTPVSEPAWVHYGQLYVESSENSADLHECFAGQRNGLCGAAVPGKLFLITGLHTGKVGHLRSRRRQAARADSELRQAFPGL